MSKYVYYEVYGVRYCDVSDDDSTQYAEYVMIDADCPQFARERMETLLNQSQVYHWHANGSPIYQVKSVRLPLSTD